MNLALTIEYFESEVFYPAALEAGILSGESEAVAVQLADIEAQHREALIEAIASLGGTPIERPEFSRSPTTCWRARGAFLEAALAQEMTDVGASLGLAPVIQSPDVLAAAGAILGVEGENVVALRQLLGLGPYAAEAFPRRSPRTRYSRPSSRSSWAGRWTRAVRSTGTLAASGGCRATPLERGAVTMIRRPQQQGSRATSALLLSCVLFSLLEKDGTSLPGWGV